LDPATGAVAENERTAWLVGGEQAHPRRAVGCFKLEDRASLASGLLRRQAPQTCDRYVSSSSS
jgi:hypothetical protein